MNCRKKNNIFKFYVFIGMKLDLFIGVLKCGSNVTSINMSWVHKCQFNKKV